MINSNTVLQSVKNLNKHLKVKHGSMGPRASPAHFCLSVFEKDDLLLSKFDADEVAHIGGYKSSGVVHRP